MNSILNESKKRKPTQKSRMIEALIEAGENGVTNYELSNIATCYTARLSELYSVGYSISVTHMGNGLYKYVLKHAPEMPKKHVKKIDVVTKKINDDYSGKISVNELDLILDELNINVSRKSFPNFV